MAKLFSIVIKEIPNIIPSLNCSIFVLTPNLIFNKQLVDFSLVLQKSFIEGKNIDVIGNCDNDVIDP